LRIERGAQPFGEECGYAFLAGGDPVMHGQPFLSSQ
jgi:hypothetical protein